MSLTVENANAVPHAIHTSPSTDASRLALQYVDAMYYEPVGPDGKLSLTALNKLLENATIIWIRDGKKETLDLAKMDGKLLRGYYLGMNSIEVLTAGFASVEMSPIATTKTIQVWDGDLSHKPAWMKKEDNEARQAGPYMIDSSIRLEVGQNQETKAYYISQVVHNYTTEYIGSKTAPQQEQAVPEAAKSKRWWTLGLV